MNERRYQLPSMAALVAFESAVRHGSFTRAAAELNTSQSAISRQISGLEADLGTALFDRVGRHVEPTDAGRWLHRATSSGLDTVQHACRSLRDLGRGDRLTIACSHDISHLLVMPRHGALQGAAGAGTRIRIMTYEYDTPDIAQDPRIDLLITYDAALGGAGSEPTTLMAEAIVPVAAPGLGPAVGRARPPDALARDLAAHLAAGALPLLEVTRPGQGWSSWADWFARVGHPMSKPLPATRRRGFDSYVYLLEAAVAGQGIALGWRGLVDGYLADGRLVPLLPDFMESDNRLFAVLTGSGRRNPIARRALDLLVAVETTPAAR